MSKILLAYEEYTELMMMETSLKKVGFDVIGITSEFSVSEQLVSFNPDVVVAFGHSSKVSSLGVGRRLKEAPRWQGKSVLVFKPQMKPQPEDILKVRADLFLESPIQPRMMLQVLGRLLQIDEAVLQDKLDKLSLFEAQQKAAQPQDTGRGGASGIGSSEESVYVGGGSGGVDEGNESKGLFSFRQKEAKELYQGPEEETSSDSSTATAASIFDVDIDSLEAEMLGKKPQVDAPPVKPVDPASSDRISELPAEKAQARTNQSIEGTGVQALTPAEAAKTVKEHSSDWGAELGGEPLDPQVLQKLRSELSEAEAQSAQRELIYQSFLINTEKPKKSTVTRIEAKKRHREIQKAMNAEKLGDQDQLRRAFVKAMFKK